MKNHNRHNLKMYILHEELISLCLSIAIQIQTTKNMKHLNKSHIQYIKTLIQKYGIRVIVPLLSVCNKFLFRAIDVRYMF